MTITNRSAPGRLVMSVSLGLAVALGAGCSLVIDLDDECEGDQDCPSDRVCRQKLCVDPPAGDVGADAGGDVGGDAGALTPADLLVAPCERVLGVELENALDPDVILIGTLFAKTGDLSGFGQPHDNAVELAVTEINQAGGLFGKQLAVLVCDSGTDPDQAKQGAQHLIEVAKVPVIIGPSASSITVEVFTKVAKDAGVVVISPSATSPSITSLPDNDLLWRTAPSDSIQGGAIAAYLLDKGYGKVAVVNRGDTYGNGLRDAIQDNLCGTLDCNNEDVYLPLSYPDSSFEAEISTIILELQAFAPEVTVLIAFNEDGSYFLDLAADTDIRNYVSSDGMSSTAMFTSLPDDLEMLCHVLGTQPASPSGETFQSFALRYKAKFKEDPGSMSANAYDATYLIAYAMAAAGDASLTGAKIAEGLARMSAGEEVEVGPNDWNATIQKLSSSATATVDFVGASGPLDLNEHGEAPSSIEGWYYDVDEERLGSFGVIYTADGAYTAPVFTGLPGHGAACEASGGR